jgi:hypothetical protein
MFTEKSGVVSIWLGILDTQDEFYEYISEKYNDDGDYISSDFVNDFNLSWYDHDKQEAVCLGKEVDIADCLNKASYSPSYLAEVIKTAKSRGVVSVNSAILLFDYEVNSAGNDSKKLIFLGTFDYDNSV